MIREPPSAGPAPVNGVDKDGFELSEELPARPNYQDSSSSVQLDPSRPSSHRQIQFNFRDNLAQTGERADLIKERQGAIKEMIQHAWTGYMKYAAPHDELLPVTGTKEDTIHGWGVTLFESLDTLLLAGMTKEYEDAKRILLEKIQSHHPWNQPNDSAIDQSKKEREAEEKQEAETRKHAKLDNIFFYDGVTRYLGSLLSVIQLDDQHDTSNILDIALSLGDRLLQAFTGSKHLPNTVIPKTGTKYEHERAADKVYLAQVGTFQLEFRKLSQLSGNDRFTEMAQKNFEYFSSMNTKVPGLYPAYFFPETNNPKDYMTSFGTLSDRFYEYLLKTFMLTGDTKFKDLYITSIDAMHSHLVSRPHKKSEPYLVLGVYDTATDSLVPKMDHASCFAPGLLALGSRSLGRPKDLTVAKGLLETCYLSYKNSATGLGADEIGFLGKEFSKGSSFEMPPPLGFYVMDPEYILGPETVESLFVMYRITGDAKYQDYAWEIAQSIERNCKTRFGYSNLANVMDASEGMADRMPSHFISQTLKYLYLIFSSPELVSLDDYLFTAQGHLMKYSN
ncbi:hypothetical protein BGZ76_002007 [Entomortierella beljakovae]|nr:hypothetical protein BGZ76_002007 [Entomortierella beljakovae]